MIDDIEGMLLEVNITKLHEENAKLEAKNQELEDSLSRVRLALDHIFIYGTKTKHYVAVLNQAEMSSLMEWSYEEV